MITYEQDPDVFQWGLQLFDGDPFSSCGYYSSVTQDDADYYLGHYYKENHYDTECNNVESDELIAHALQEELSQLAVAEEPNSPLKGGGHLQVSVLQQDWVGQSMDNYGPGKEEADDMEPSSSCSSPDEKSYYGNEWSYSLEMMDEFVLDDEVGKRFNQMVPVPHVPRINGEIPSIDEATVDHQRLLGRLQLYDLVELKVKGDGNCQFRALSDQFYRSPEHHKFVRQQVVNQLKTSPDIYEGYVPMGFGDYLEKMSRSGEWGDHLTLQAASDSYGVKIFVMTSFKDTCYIEIIPNVQRSNKVIFLSFWAEVHYNSIYPEEDVPALESRKKKKWRVSQNNHLELPTNTNDWQASG